MPDVCSCKNSKKSIYTIDQCPKCWLYINDLPYRMELEAKTATWQSNQTNQQAIQPPTPKPKKPCLYLGKVIDRAACNCPGKWVHECEKHGKCRRGMTKDGIQGCIGCPDFVEDD